MSYLDNYIVPDMVHPYNEDKAIQTIRTAIEANSIWLQYCLLRVFRYTDADGKEYPAYYPMNNGKNHRIITPDNNTISMAYFELLNKPEFPGLDTGQPTKYQLAFVCWFNQLKVDSTIAEDMTNVLINDILNVLQILCAETMVKETDLSKIFDYSGLDLKKLYQMGNQFKAFKITFDYYQCDCFDKYTYTPPIGTTPLPPPTH